MVPMSVTAGVIGIAAVALHSTKRMVEFIDSIQGVPQAVKALSRDLNALEKVLQKLIDVLGDPDF
jgi:Fungal N-terminal domain of STAND proteins